VYALLDNSVRGVSPMATSPSIRAILEPLGGQCHGAKLSGHCLFWMRIATRSGVESLKSSVKRCVIRRSLIDSPESHSISLLRICNRLIWHDVKTKLRELLPSTTGHTLLAWWQPVHLRERFEPEFRRLTASRSHEGRDRVRKGNTDSPCHRLYSWCRRFLESRMSDRTGSLHHSAHSRPAPACRPCVAGLP